MKRLVCAGVISAFAVACSSGSGTPQGGATPQGQPAAAAQAPPAGAPQPATAATPNATPAAGAPPTSASGSAVPASPPAAATTAAPPRPTFHDVTIPSGTTLNLTLTTAVSSDKSRVEEPVRAKLARPIVIDGATAVPTDAELSGTVLAAQQSGRVKGRASVAFRFDRLQSGDATYDIRTAHIAREAAATKGSDAKKVGIGAGAGALIGAIAGGGKGAAIGTAVGAGAGAGAVVATRGKEVQLAPGTAVKTTLQAPLTVHVRVE